MLNAYSIHIMKVDYSKCRHNIPAEGCSINHVFPGLYGDIDPFTGGTVAGLCQEREQR